MKKIGIFWGSSTDNTTTAALFMKEYLEMNDHVVEAHNIEETDPEKILEYDNNFTFSKDRNNLKGV